MVKGAGLLAPSERRGVYSSCTAVSALRSGSDRVYGGSSLLPCTSPPAAVHAGPANDLLRVLHHMDFVVAAYSWRIPASESTKIHVGDADHPEVSYRAL